MSPIMKAYYKWLKKECLSHMLYGGFANGLCNSFHGDYVTTLNLFRPSGDELDIMRDNGYSSVYWGSGLGDNRLDPQAEVVSGFTELRQTIVLLIAAMHDELD